MNTELYKRQWDIINPRYTNKPIHIIGAGGTGSWIALLLAKMGCNDITIYDFDKVEEHNVASQFFKVKQKGQMKVDALTANVLEQTDINIKAITDIKLEENITTGLVIFAIDEMSERIRLGKIYTKHDIYIIDGRMGGLQAEVYCHPSNKYLACTCPPEKIEKEKCTERAICFNCAILAGLIANYTKDYLMGTLKEQEIILMLSDVTLFKKTSTT